MIQTLGAASLVGAVFRSHAQAAMSQSASSARIVNAADFGARGRVRIANSLTYFGDDADVQPGDVCLGASFAGVPSAAVPLARGVRGWIAHEAGPGKDDAGISGLSLSDRFGVPAAAVATMTSRLSDGNSLLGGVIAHANLAARKLGVKPGQSGDEAARRMLDAPMGRAADVKAIVDERVYEFVRSARGSVRGVWSLSLIKEAHPNDVFCVASHGAIVMADYARPVAPKGVIANDAGFGLDRSGTSGLEPLAMIGIAAATVSTDSARIGDSKSTYEDGMISALNAIAARAGVTIGMSAVEASQRMLDLSLPQHIKQ
jgi:hypothetical protein